MTRSRGVEASMEDTVRYVRELVEQGRRPVITIKHRRKPRFYMELMNLRVEAYRAEYLLDTLEAWLDGHPYLMVSNLKVGRIHSEKTLAGASEGLRAFFDFVRESAYAKAQDTSARPSGDTAGSDLPDPVVQPHA